MQCCKQIKLIVVVVVVVVTVGSGRLLAGGPLDCSQFSIFGIEPIFSLGGLLTFKCTEFSLGMSRNLLWGSRSQVGHTSGRSDGKIRGSEQCSVPRANIPPRHYSRKNTVSLNLGYSAFITGRLPRLALSNSTIAIPSLSCLTLNILYTR